MGVAKMGRAFLAAETREIPAFMAIFSRKNSYFVSMS
jgi:hypothetical protein